MSFRKQAGVLLALLGGYGIVSGVVFLLSGADTPDGGATLLSITGAFALVIGLKALFAK